MAFGSKKPSAKTMTIKSLDELWNSPAAASYDDKISSLFSAQSVGEITSLLIHDLTPYHEHSYRLYEGERKNDLIESIKAHGIMQPIIVRETRPGSYEILAGHNRVEAAKEAGLDRIPAIVHPSDLSDEDAKAIVHITNLMQRGFSELRPSEQAYIIAGAYGELFSEDKKNEIKNALENTEKPHENATEEARYPMDNGVRKVEVTGAEYGLSQASVARLLRINALSDTLKMMLDDNTIGLRVGVALSYLSDQEQKNVELSITDHKRKVDIKASERLKDASKKCGGQLSMEDVLKLIDGKKKRKDSSDKKYKVEAPIDKEYYDTHFAAASKKEIANIVRAALNLYFKAQQQSPDYIPDEMFEDKNPD